MDRPMNTPPVHPRTAKAVRLRLMVSIQLGLYLIVEEYSNSSFGMRLVGELSIGSFSIFGFLLLQDRI